MTNAHLNMIRAMALDICHGVEVAQSECEDTNKLYFRLGVIAGEVSAILARVHEVVDQRRDLA